VRIHQELLQVRTRGAGLQRIDAEIAAVVARAAMGVGLCTIFIRHTSASLLIQENAAPSARRDLEEFFSRLCPESEAGERRYTHDDEGPDDMPAHLRAALTQTSLAVPLVDGRLGLGTWQGVYLFEHRRRGPLREVIVQVLGE
jgi:secondary thiamine-phosphate synthase enzyme